MACGKTDWMWSSAGVHAGISTGPLAVDPVSVDGIMSSNTSHSTFGTAHRAVASSFDFTPGTRPLEFSPYPSQASTNANVDLICQNVFRSQ